MAEERVMHPEAQVPLDPTMVDRRSLIQNLEEAVSISQEQDKQIKQSLSLVSELRGEVEKLTQELKQFEIFRPILKRDRDLYTAYIRDPILIQQLQGRVRQWYGKIAQIESIDKDERKLAHRLVDDVIEECVRECVLFQWHRIQQRLEDKRNAQRPTVA